jgi:hypothetical protein
MKTPVILIIFNRSDLTQRVFDMIKLVKPKKLLVIADGPRNESEKAICDRTRSIIDQVDWDCEVIKNYSEFNEGCIKKISTGLNWAFNIVDRAIVLEADCLPDISFFKFCDVLLEKYKDDERVMHIGGNFFQKNNKKFKCSSSYYFSSIPHIWGWATWSRAWKLYDVNMTKWPEIRDRKGIKMKDPAVYEYWETVWNQYYDKKIDSWDGQWTFSCILNEGISITPCTNLVSNIGFGPDAIHTKDVNSIFSNMEVRSIDFPLIHPADMTINSQADKFTWSQNFGIDRLRRQRLLGPIRRKLPFVYSLIRNLIKKNR